MSYRYEPDLDVHVVDCAGLLTLEVGIDRVGTLERELAQRPPRNGVFKLLMDFRETIWADESVHMQLSRVTREALGLRPDNAGVRVAIVNSGWAEPIADNERWFLTSSDALQWLCE